MLDPSHFQPPGPGVWELEVTHMTRPLSRWFTDVFPAAAVAGFKATTARYGLLLDYMDFAVINRFMYLCPRGVGAPKGAKGPPPRLIFQLLTKVHPAVRRRIRDVREVFATKRWRADVARWDSEWRPAIERENRELQDVELGPLSDAQLRAHLNRCTDAVRRAITLHHTLNGTCMLPLGDFLAHVREWTGLQPADALPLFRGASRVSQGAAPELDALALAIAADAGAAMLLAGSDPRTLLDALQARTDDAGRAARAYVAAAGVRVATGNDVADLTLADMPELLVANIRAAIASRSRSEDEGSRHEAAIRDRVPARHHARFDDLLGEARLTYRIRDERGYLNDAWSTGIARRAILAAGARLAAKGRLLDAEHAVELTPSELDSMLGGDSGPGAEETAAHASFRAAHTTQDAPPLLGGTPGGPPPADWLPPDAARAQRAIDIVLGEMFAARERQKSKTTINGFAASSGSIVGVARLVRDPRDMARVVHGDVLITQATAPSYNALLPLLAGIVTDRGGTLSHAAVVAREYGIPAVVGCGNATELIRDGDRVRIDGAAGTVEILA
jgi:pyruvate,water dikinase